MASSPRRRVRPEAAVGIAVGVVALTAAAALAVGRSDPIPGSSPDRPPGHSRSEWARDHHGPPPWAHGKGHGERGDRHGPSPWAHGHKGHDKDHGRHHGPDDTERDS
jgi:hypothetical protein